MFHYNAEIHSGIGHSLDLKGPTPTGQKGKGIANPINYKVDNFSPHLEANKSPILINPISNRYARRNDEEVISKKKGISLEEGQKIMIDPISGMYKIQE